MDNSLVSRNAYLSEFEVLISRCSKKLETILAAIGWNEESLKNKESSLQNQDSTETEAMLPLDTEEPSAQLEDFEKRYNALLAELPNQSKKTHEKSETQNLVELLEFERNAKRRRISYKNRVHTKNKSHTEVMRELVLEQMAVLKDMAGVETGDSVIQENAAPVHEEVAIDGMIQVGFTRGNPYTLWRGIGKILENREESQQSQREVQKFKVRDRRSVERQSKGSPSREKPGSSREWRCHDERARIPESRREKHKKRERSSHEHKRRHRSNSGSRSHKKKKKKRRSRSSDSE